MSRYVIDKKGLDDNIELIIKKAGVPVIGVVKGNGYGFGIREFTRALQAHGIKTFAVTEVTDIPVLKEILSDEDILVLRSTGVAEEAKIIAENGCIATIGSTVSAEVMNSVAEELGITVKCHLKIDTGLARYGFMPSRVEEAIKCYELPNLEFTGIYTHFSQAFENVPMTQQQLTVFKDTVEQIKEAVGEVGTVHAANSPALLNAKDVALDAVRIGSAFTGRVITHSETGLKRLGVLEAEVVETRIVPKGHQVGYVGLYTAPRDTEVAIVPFGHGDGFGLTVEHEEFKLFHVLSTLKRVLNKQKIYVKIDGKSYPVIGCIGLTHTAVDVTGSGVKAGDVAQADISPLMVNTRVPRIYK